MENVPLNQRYNQESFIGKDVDDQTYANLPVQDYGLEMIKQMGWNEKKGIGKNCQNQLVKPIEFIPKHHRLGLGADINPLLKGDAKSQLISKTGKNYNYIGEELVEKKKFLDLNYRVKIIEGKYEDLKGIITKIINEEEFWVELANGEILKCLEHELLPIDENKEKKQKDVKNEKNEKKDKERESRSRSGSKKKKDKKKKKDQHEKDEKKKKSVKWVRPNIRVRIISKKYKDGKYYNIKAFVQDVIDKYTFSLVTPNKEFIDELREKDIETVIPEIDKNVIVLVEPFKGEQAKLISRDKKKDLVRVQLYNDLQIYEFTQDEVSEYCNNFN